MWGEGRRMVLLACGSFNPPTCMHLRMMELAREILEVEFKCDVVEGVFSPVADTYGKLDLAPAQHRLNMLTLATRDSDWLIPDGWEASQGNWTRTIEVLRYHQQRVHKKYGPNVQVVLVAGGDFVDSFKRKLESGEWLWHKEDLINIVKRHGIICLVREGLRAHPVFDSIKFLANYKDFCLEIQDDVCPNAISSTRIRDAIRRGRSLKYALDDAIINYIEKHNLYTILMNAVITG